MINSTSSSSGIPLSSDVSGVAMLPSSLAPLRTEQSAGSGTREDRGIFPLSSVSSFSMQGEDASKKTDPVLSTMNEEDDMMLEDESERLQRGRERNREHARRTRLRKKAQLQELQGTYRAKLAERTQLQQQLQERRIASILLGLSSSTPALEPLGDSSESLGEIREPPPTASALEEDALFSSALPMPKRKRGFPEVAPTSTRATLHIHGLAIPSKSHINWKTGMYADEMGQPKQMTPQQLEALRRERNRMHAKMTRDRKKCFVATMEKAIDDLDQELAVLRSNLEGESSSSSGSNSNLVTPELTARPSPTSSQRSGPTVISFSSSEEEETPRAQKRTCHGFSLDE